MKCHACGQPMPLDRWGHPVHDGPCSGYPAPKPAATEPCPHCGHEIASRNWKLHAKRCTEANPVGPAPQSSRSRICPRCHTAHSPVCPPLAARWPLDALAAVLGTEGLQTRLNGLGVNSESYASWVQLGIPDNAADRVACAAGYHPASIWPGWFDAGITAIDRAKAENRAWRHMWLADELNRSQQQEQAA